MALLAFVLERRRLRLANTALGFLLGDPLLALAVVIGVSVSGPGEARVVNAPLMQLTIAAGWLIFGLWQWRADVLTGVYNMEQAMSPTKIWHQIVIYPFLGCWTFTATLPVLIHPLRDSGATALIAVCTCAWAALCFYDVRHPKLGHIPYDWLRLRPRPRPWSGDSRTLRADLQRQLSGD
ncbi:MAG TPA: hypothetical protein VGL39_28000 [Jatrophihabitantaceae bacterium]